MCPLSSAPPRISDRISNPLAARRLAALALLLGALGLPLLGPAPANAQATPPSVPRNVQVTPGDAQFTVTWQAPNSWGTWTAGGFEIFWKLSSGGGDAWSAVDVPGRTIDVFTPTETSFVFKGTQQDYLFDQLRINNGDSYDLRIRAYTEDPNNAGSYLESSWVTVSNQVGVSPLDVQVTAGDGRLDLSWTAQAEVNGKAVTGYFVDYTEAASGVRGLQVPDSDPSTDWVRISRSGTATTQAITGLTNETPYRVRVHAFNLTRTTTVTGTPPVSTVIENITAGNSGFAAGTPFEPLPDGTYWEATLTPFQAGSGNSVTFGCNTAGTQNAYKCSTAATLSEDSFTIRGTQYQIYRIADVTRPDRNYLDILFSPGDTAAIRQLNFCVGTTAYPLSDAGHNPGGGEFNWASTDAGWSAGSAVKLSLGTSCPSADLKGLTATSSSSASGTFASLTLAPSFDADTTSYSATVANTLRHVKLTPTAAHSGSTITVQGTAVTSGSPSGAIALNVGTNTLTVRVAAQGGSPTKDYTVTITRQPPPASSNANLSGLRASTATSASGTFTTLNIGSFAASTTSYSATVDDTITHAKLRPTAAHSAATITVRGSGVTSGSASNAIALRTGANILTVRVTAQDGTTTKDYTVTITRQPAEPPAVSLSASPRSVREGSAVTVTVRLSAALAASVTIPLRLTAGTAEAGDYGALAGIEIAAGRTRGTGRITTADDDDTDDETFTVALDTANLPSTVTAGDTSSVQVTIADGDARASLTVAPNPVKDGGSVTVTVTLSRALRSSVTVPVTLTRDTSESEDHGTLTGVRVNARATSGTARIAIRHDDDTDDEAFSVAIDTGNLPSNVVAGSPTSARVVIDDDDTPTVSLYVTPNPVVAGEPVTVEARLSAALPRAVTIPLTLAAGATSGSRELSTTGDQDQEYEWFKVELDGGNLPAQVAAGRRQWVRVQIAPAPATTAAAWLSASPNPVDEGAAVTVTAHLDEALNRDVTITILIRLIRDGGDVFLPTEDIRIAAGATSGTYVLQTKHDDDARDGEVTVGIAQMSDGVWPGGSADRPSSVRITVKDDDVPAARAAQSVWLLPAASDPWLRGTLRVANRSATPGEATLRVTDDSGRSYGPLTLALGAHAAAQFDAADLERGNPATGLTGSTGPGVGDWRIDIDSLLEIEATAYAQASDGFAAPLDAVVPARDDGTLEVALFNPAREVRQRSLLRLVNPGANDAPVTVSGVDDAGRPGRAPLRLVVPAGAACTLDAAQLESGTGLACGVSQTGLGDGHGRWRLAVVSESPLVAMNLLASPDGRLANLSSGGSPDSDGVWRVALFPAGSDPGARRGLLRIANRAGRAGRVLIQAADDGDAAYPPLSLGLAAGQTVHLDSWDLELGNRAKGLAPGTGTGRGAWRLALAGDIEFEAHAYVRAPDGFLSALPASRSGRAHRVALLEPRRGVLRLVNPGAHGASVLVSATDDVGGEGAVRVAVPAGAAVELTAAALESGQAGAIVSGALGDGTGGWRLSLEADRALSAMSLLAGPGGHTAELSGTRREAAAQPPPGGPHAAAEPRAEGDVRDAR